MINITLYSRSDCSLCEELLSQLNLLKSQYPHTTTIINIDEDEKLKNAYTEKVPVLIIGPYQLQAPITEDQLRITLGAALDREKHQLAAENAALAGKKNESITSADKLSFWISKHYLAVFNLVIFLYVGIPFVAPYLMKVDYQSPARLIYTGYGYMCHQLAFRSLFLFGPQSVYPKASVQAEGLITYEEATGNDPTDLWAAREFVGNEQIGFKVALCQRDVAIYFGILAFGLLFGSTGRKIPSLPWYLWLLIGIVPIGLDGFTQLLSQLGISQINSLIPLRESTPMLRYITGFLFGFSTAWFGYPLVESSMKETRNFMQRKFERLENQTIKPV